jgi:hypothetical protein
MSCGACKLTRTTQVIKKKKKIYIYIYIQREREIGSILRFLKLKGLDK